jgi:hypothetical protein
MNGVHEADFQGVKWWSGRGSNPRPRHCERRALPTELPPRHVVIIHVENLFVNNK